MDLHHHDYNKKQRQFGCVEGNVVKSKQKQQQNPHYLDSVSPPTRNHISALWQIQLVTLD